MEREGGGIMKRYFVDLRSYSGDEYDQKYKLLKGWAFICNIILRQPHTFEVFWDRPESIEEITGISSQFIHLQY